MGCCLFLYALPTALRVPTSQHLLDIATVPKSQHSVLGSKVHSIHVLGTQSTTKSGCSGLLMLREN